MNKIKIFFLLLKKGIRLFIDNVLDNKIKISKNKNVKIKENITENTSIIIQRNDDCEILQNKFIKK